MPLFPALLHPRPVPALGGVHALPAVLSLHRVDPGEVLTVGVCSGLPQSRIHRQTLDDVLGVLSSKQQQEIFVSLLVEAPHQLRPGVFGPHRSMPPQPTRLEVTDDWERFPDSIGLILGNDFLTPLWKQSIQGHGLILQHLSGVACVPY